MSDVLFAWDLGSGLGHLRPLLSVAQALAARGHAPVFAAREVATAWSTLRSTGYPILQAPYWTTRKVPFRARTFGDILGFCGWAEPADLESNLRAWDALLDQVRPALVVLDHAPSLALAAKGRVPAVQIGNGFCVPPAHLDAFPVFQADGTTTATEEAMLRCVAEVQRRRGGPAVERLPAIHSDCRQFVTSLAAFDPYAEFRREPAAGPLDVLGPKLPLPPAPAWFAYLSLGAETTADVLRSLVRSGIPGETYVRGMKPALRKELEREGVRVHDRPVPMTEALPRVSIVVHHAGTGLAAIAMAAGRPQVVLPRQPEQRFTADSLVRLGVAVEPDGPGAAGDAVLRLASGAGFAAAAAREADALDALGPRGALDLIVGACEARLEGKK